LPIDGERKWCSVAPAISVDLDHRQFKLQRRNANNGIDAPTTAHPDAGGRSKSKLSAGRWPTIGLVNP
jgi:hypothetical protein